MLAASATARADCSVDLVPNSAGAGWEQAAREARRRLVDAPSRECASVELAVSAKGGALLTFTTTDGRRAVRALLSPDEVLPALEALLVTRPATADVPVAAPAAPPAPSTPSPAPALASVPSPGPALSSAPQPEPLKTRFVLGGAAGLRLGVAGAYASPALLLRPSLTLGRWELGAVAEWDPAYAYLPGGTPPGFSLWSFQAGFAVGRRQPLGPFELGLGLGLGVAAVRENADPVAGSTADRSLDTAQPRASTYVRLVALPTARVRPTFEAGVDLALGQLARQGSEKRDLPDLPRWGFTFAAGVETSLLP